MSWLHILASRFILLLCVISRKVCKVADIRVGVYVYVCVCMYTLIYIFLLSVMIVYIE